MPDPLPIGRKTAEPTKKRSSPEGENLAKSLKPAKTLADIITKGPLKVAQAVQKVGKLPGKAFGEAKDKAKKARSLVKKLGI